MRRAARWYRSGVHQHAGTAGRYRQQMREVARINEVPTPLRSAPMTTSTDAAPEPVLPGDPASRPTRASDATSSLHLDRLEQSRIPAQIARPCTRPSYLVAQSPRAAAGPRLPPSASVTNSARCSASKIAAASHRACPCRAAGVRGQATTARPPTTPRRRTQVQNSRSGVSLAITLPAIPPSQNPGDRPALQDVHVDRAARLMRAPGSWIRRGNDNGEGCADTERHACVQWHTSYAKTFIENGDRTARRQCQRYRPENRPRRRSPTTAPPSSISWDERPSSDHVFSNA